MLAVALGIGAKTGIFGMVNGYARALPVRNPDRPGRLRPPRPRARAIHCGTMSLR